ncbi:MAG: phosphoribosylglycinamide formyltransferase [Flavobacteriaceae bacterium]|nr:phosphoribosylglycinamide formyltransferase [Flavobacteriaceae bacterium]
MKNDVKKIILFASGEGSNVENIIKHFHNNTRVDILLVAGNNENARALDKAKSHGIKILSFDRFFFTNRLLEDIKKMKPDLIILAGFLWKIPSYWIDDFSDRIMNIHPSLLPKYGGKGMYGMNIHKAVKKNKETETGITIHLVNKDYDKGKIIFQKRIEISTSLLAEDIAMKVKELERVYFPQIIEGYLFKQL